MSVAPKGYTKVNVVVTEIRDRSVFFQNLKLLSVEVSMGRSLLHAASDDRLTKYSGPLPVKMTLSIRDWWVESPRNADLIE